MHIVPVLLCFDLCNPKQPHEDVKDEQVKGIESIEEVFCHGALYEATTAVVEVDGNEGQASYPAQVQETKAYRCLKDTVIAHHIQQQYETNTTAAIVASQQDWRNDAGKDSDGKTGIALRKDGLREILLPLRLPLADCAECE